MLWLWGIHLLAYDRDHKQNARSDLKTKTNRQNKNVQQADNLTQKNVQETLPGEVYELTKIQM